MLRRVVLLFLLMAGSVLATEEFRVFHVGDRTVSARIVSVDLRRDQVVLELRNKRRKKVSPSIFSQEDQDYINDYVKVKEFLSSRYKVEIKKNILDRRDETVGTQGAIERKTETICYDINISNGTDTTIEGVSIAYNIFYEQEELGRRDNEAREFYVDDSLTIKSLLPREKTSFRTKKFEIYSQRLGGGYDGYVDGHATHQSGKSKGIWLKIYLKTPSGLSAMKEVCLPKNGKSIFRWQSS